MVTCVNYDKIPLWESRRSMAAKASSHSAACLKLNVKKAKSKLCG